LAVVPAFMGAGTESGDMAKHYVKQVCGERVPTVADWQKLAAMKLPDADKWLHAPIGQGHFVMAMCLDKQNNLWVGTEGEGLYRWSAVDGMWTQYVATKNPPPDSSLAIPASAIECGMGDNSVYALACDIEGRIWAGHLNHGVSVFNGEKWQTYEVVGGLSRPDTLNGPLGERIFKIAVAPGFGEKPEAGSKKQEGPVFHDSVTGVDSAVAGSVWMASSAGIAIYFPATDSWSYVTRAEGLPSDQANAITFDGQGRVYVGTQCDGIAMADPADHYATWKQVTAANPTPHVVDGKIVDSPVPTVGKGTGLPTDLINDLLVAQDGMVYAATTLGLAWSTDRGNSWQFVRGADWVDKVKNRLGGPPADWKEPSEGDKGGAILAEDYVTTLSEDSAHNILVGHRAMGADVLSRVDSQHSFPGRVGNSDNVCVTSYVAMATNRNALRGTYGFGVSVHEPEKNVLEQRLVNASSVGRPAAMPKGGKPPTLESLQRRMEHRIPVILNGGPAAACVGEDWMTQGDWRGRYGRQYAVLCAARAPLDETVMAASDISVKATIDPSFKPGEGLRAWLEGPKANHPSALWDPYVGARRQAEWDDHGEGYPASREGPDIWVSVALPEGTFRVSLYVFAFRGQEHAVRREYRDLVVDVGTREAVTQPLKIQARTRIEHFNNGVYKQFLVQGGATHVFHLGRNFSYNALVNGVFVDRLAGPPSRHETVAMPAMGYVNYGPPKIEIDESTPVDVRRAVTVWLPGPNGEPTLESASRACRVEGYRATMAQGGPHPSLEALRWAAPLWGPSDREVWNDTMKKGWESFLQINPSYAARMKAQAEVEK
jgi:hypothetical protein